MKTLILDLETRSTVDLKNSNAWVYSEHESTDVLMLCYKPLGESEVKTWLPGDPVPAEFMELETCFVSHNVQFEFSIFYNILCKKHEFPLRICQLSKWVDTMQMGVCHGLPGRLEDMAKFLNLEQKKGSDGSHLIKLFSIPKSTKDGIVWHETTQEQFNQFVGYCKQDVIVTELLYNKFINSKNYELEKPIIDLDMWQNLTGLPVDLESTKAIINRLDSAKSEAMEKAQELFDINPRSPQQMVRKLAEYGCNFENMQKETIEEYLETCEDKEIKQLLTLRLFLSKASTGKFYALEKRTDAALKIRQWLKYMGAGPGRWSGRGFQPHNLPKTGLSMDVIEDILTEFKDNTIDFWSIMDKAKSVIPCMIKAEQGKAFVNGDFAGIEARVLAYMVNQKELLKGFKDGEDVYIQMASIIFKVKAETIDKKDPKRTIGKTAILGCGFGQGHVRFIDTVKKQTGMIINKNEAKNIVDTYRETYPEIPAFWKAAMTAFESAYKNKGQQFKTHGCIFEANTKWLTIQLPSGRKIYYHGIRFDGSGYYGEWSCINVNGKGDRKKLYGGLIVENIVQGTARDIMANRMLKLKDSGLSPLLHVHDEVICYEDKDRIEETRKVFDGIMNTAPDWLPGFPLLTESEICERYHK